MDQNLNITATTIKLLGEHIRKWFDDTLFGTKFSILQQKQKR